jgi:hypothetical protein
LIQNRTRKFRNEPAEVTGDDYWFHLLEDKVAAYLLSVEQNFTAPEIFCCITNHTDLAGCLNTRVPPDVDGVVIKATNFHSSQGVYVLVKDGNNNTMDLLTGMPMTYQDVISALEFLQATKIIVEEFIGTELPIEYKFHVINGSVAAVDIIAGRGTNCPCYAVLDGNMTDRLDYFGCFEPGGYEMIDDDNCTSIDFVTGALRAGPVKKDLNLCDKIPILDDCLRDEMIQIALKLGDRIGVYMRVDMFVAGGKVYVQEYTTNHMNGIRHCAARYDPTTDCIDSCFMGRMWGEKGGLYGGIPTVIPSTLDKYLSKSPQEQCDLLIDVPAPLHRSFCTNVGPTSSPPPFLLP